MIKRSFLFVVKTFWYIGYHGVRRILTNWIHVSLIHYLHLWSSLFFCFLSSAISDTCFVYFTLFFFANNKNKRQINHKRYKREKIYVYRFVMWFILPIISVVGIFNLSVSDFQFPPYPASHISILRAANFSCSGFANSCRYVILKGKIFGEGGKNRKVSWLIFVDS